MKFYDISDEQIMQLKTLEDDELRRMATLIELESVGTISSNESVELSNLKERSEQISQENRAFLKSLEAK